MSRPSDSRDPPKEDLEEVSNPVVLRVRAAIGHTTGNPRYRNREYPEAMPKIRLQPMTVDDPNIMIGQHVSDIVLEDGLFEIACGHCLKMGGAWLWTPESEGEIAANGNGGPNPHFAASRWSTARMKTELFHASFAK